MWEKRGFKASKLNKKAVIILVLLVSLILLSTIWYYTTVEQMRPHMTWASIDGRLEVEEINKSADCVVYTLTNFTLISHTGHPEDEKLPLYSDQNQNEYNFDIYWHINTTSTSHNWSYVDTDHNNLITNGDRFILYNYSSYDIEGGYFSIYVPTIDYISGNIKGDIPPKLEESK